MTIHIPEVWANLGIALLLMGAIWYWNRWDCLHRPNRPHRRSPHRWYSEAESAPLPPPARWDLQELNRRFRARSSSAEGGPDDSHGR